MPAPELIIAAMRRPPLCPANITAMLKQCYYNARYENIFCITKTANEDRPERSGDIP
jgi:hypothetical protein